MSDGNFNPTSLRDALVSGYSLEDLKELCFELRESGVSDLDFESLEGEQKNAKARELVEFFRRRDRLDQLAEFMQRRTSTFAGAMVEVLFEPFSSVGQIHVVAISGLDPATSGNGFAPIDLESLAAGTEDESQDIVQEKDDGKLFFSSLGNLPALLRRTIAAMKAAGGREKPTWRVGVHSENLCVGPNGTKTFKIPAYCKALASSVMELGSHGHIVASHKAAQLLMTDQHFASSVHPVGELAGNCHARRHIYNIYGDGFGNPQPPQVKARALPKRLLGVSRKPFRRDDKHEDEHASWVLCDSSVPNVIHTTRPEKIELTFCASLSYVRIQFDAGKEFQIARCELRSGEFRRLSANDFDCRFNRVNGYNRLAFKVTQKGVRSDTSGIIFIRCYDDSNRLVAPPIEAQIIIHRRWTITHWLLSPYYFLRDLSRRRKYIAAAALLLVVTGAVYRYVPLGSIAHSLKHLGESVLIHAHVPGYPARFTKPDGWSDPVNPTATPFEDKWDFPSGKWSVDAAWNGDPDDSAIKITGLGLGVPKGLGEESFYDLEMTTSVTFYKGHSVAWALRVQPDSGSKGLSGYVFELVKSSDDLKVGDKLSLNTYLYKSGSGSLIDHQDVPITQCCLEGDTITVEVAADHYDFDYTFTLQGDPEPEDIGRRDDVDDPKHIRVSIARRPYYRSGGFGILGTDDGTKDAPRDVRVEGWVIKPKLDKLDF